MGRDVANPTAFIRASVDMLRYLELDADANRLSDALFDALTIQKMHTPDIGGRNRSSELVEAVMENLKGSSARCSLSGRGGADKEGVAAACAS